MSAFFACCLEIILGPSDITKTAAKMLLKRKADIEELGEKPVIKRSKFDTGVVLRIKQLA